MLANGRRGASSGGQVAKFAGLHVPFSLVRTRIAPQGARYSCGCNHQKVTILPPGTAHACGTVAPQALLAGVPRGNLLLLDLFADEHPVWSRTDGFFGYPYIWVSTCDC